MDTKEAGGMGRDGVKMQEWGEKEGIGCGDRGLVIGRWNEPKPGVDR